MASAEAAPGLADSVGASLRSEVARGDLYAGAVLVRGEAMHVVCVSDPDDGTCFDPELGGAEWSASRYSAVHPPLAAWRAVRGAINAYGEVPSTEYPRRSNAALNSPISACHFRAGTATDEVHLGDSAMW